MFSPLDVWILPKSPGTGAVWPEKNLQMSIKLPKNDFDTFTKIA